jgi:asparaginyl-tRNA synthetase
MYYVCEEGVDEPGRGTTAEAPLKTAVAALMIGGPSAIVVFRKTPNEEYALLGTSALKRAKKQVEINERKAKKAEEQEAKAADNTGKEATKLEESKTIVLTEDPTLPIAVNVCPIHFGENIYSRFFALRSTDKDSRLYIPPIETCPSIWVD